MELKPGYKQTEVGLIPEDWSVEPVGGAFDVCNHLRLPISQKVREKMAGTYPYYGPTNVQGYISEYRVEGEYALIGEDGDHFLKWRDTPMTLLVNGKFNVNNHAHLITGSKNLTAWFYYFFSHKDLTPYLTRQGAGRYKLTKKTLVSIPCALPLLPEQRAIAAALSDIDALIASLDKLIAKKRDMKQAAMQQLVTGRTRLPGFSGEWRHERIRELASITTGKRNTQDKVDDGLYPFFVRSSTVERINSYSFEGEAVLTAGDGVGTGKVFHYVNGKFDFHQRVYKISDFSSDLDGYFFYLYFSNHFYDRIMSMTAKSSVDSVRLEMIANMQIPLPSSDEQNAIAAVLLDMDAEVKVLEVRRDKTKLLKQGMMQELLTGRIRLV
ncbi:MAG: restriction endonuclease subunit S [Desulfomonile tiedjei]|uniref:Restriction endonuclease subunit S n=1 Tax=Desulfomonile tiedjei TaxID=2358 RepID=A0A9D6V488_9BACT|nr:restriction endonuclease subunit S [Desulfomonile tiedjei]